MASQHSFCSHILLVGEEGGGYQSEHKEAEKSILGETRLLEIVYSEFKIVELLHFIENFR